MNIEQTIEFVPLFGFENEYEIMNEWPFMIRRRNSNKLLKESLANGYPSLHLNQKFYYKHSLIAKQFIINDDPTNKTQVDHIDRDRTNYHIENLRWVSPSSNQRNKTSNNNVRYQYVNSIPDDALIVDHYQTRNGTHIFENYYYYDNTFYFFNGIQYRVLYINTNINGLKSVNFRDNDKKLVTIYYNKFKEQYDLE